MPDAKWAQLVAMYVTVRLYSAAVAQYTRFLIRLIRLVVSVQRNSQSLLIMSSLSDQYGSRIAYVCAEALRANNEHRDAGRATESQIDLRFFEEGLLDLHKALIQLFFDFCRVDDPLRDLSLIEGRLNSLLNILPESSLHKF